MMQLNKFILFFSLMPMQDKFFYDSNQLNFIFHLYLSIADRFILEMMGFDG